MSRLTAEQQQDIAAQQGAAHETRRATVPALEAILYEPLPVLDHGFVRVVDYMGDDAAIVQAARGSMLKRRSASSTCCAGTPKAPTRGIPNSSTKTDPAHRSTPSGPASPASSLASTCR